MPGGLLPIMLLALVPMPAVEDPGVEVSCAWMDNACSAECDLEQPAACETCGFLAPCDPCEDSSCKPCPPEESCCTPEKEDCCPPHDPACDDPCGKHTICAYVKIQLGYDHWAVSVCAGVRMGPDVTSPPDVHAGPYRCSAFS